MKVLMFYLAVLLVIVGLWAVAARIYCFILQVWRMSYFGRRRAARIAAAKKRMEKIRTRSMLKDCRTWKKEIDDIYEGKKKEAETSRGEIVFFYGY